MVYMNESECYKNSRDYAAAMQKWNPDGTQHMQSGKRWDLIFKGCLYASKKGLIAQCRPMIALDGWHLKGPYEGQLLFITAKMGMLTYT